MAWIESHQGIERHPKTMKLSISMGWDIDQTIGKLHRLWWWCVDFAPDGNVSRHSADMVALAVGISSDMGEKFISSLFDAEFLDKTRKNQFLIHDWLEYAGRYLRDTKFRRNPEKIQEIINLYSTVVSRHSADKTPKISRKSAVPNQPNLTNLPNQPKEEAGEKIGAFVLPEWIDKTIWDAFEEMRKKIKKPMTDHARELIVKKLESFKAKGHDPTTVLNNSIEGDWQSVYEPKTGVQHGTGNRSGNNTQGSSGTGTKAFGNTGKSSSTDNLGSHKVSSGSEKYAELKPGDIVIEDGVETVVT